ncbi:hypothetical protein A2480_02345 [Candidatus Uhrbacteria bacterium RIFOXYC2_FULL_47_19]|uniref:Dickkopf N-terminal cysteine-rich domain-containing protein n=1 Tax=Candidatus Uhrbacteria bacterium RIFOXYC2_FULL_47_19 TaxID=1802424 RepID=A0A1F7WF05_9BACT|nr:MAG: hypothetical protein A2480_02345 [Candidatus Uhrbacteria bacterium RIFOXYC2_FULL_47_19]
MFQTQVKHGFKFRISAGLAGLLVGLNLSALVLFALIPTAQATSSLTCNGNYGCFTSTACVRAHGDFVACPAKCDTDGRSGRGFCYSRPRPVPLAVRIGSLTLVNDLAQYIDNIYRVAIGFAAILSAAMIMVGGLQWLTSGGSGQVDKARTRIMNSVIGLLLTIFAYIILNTINPALVHMQMPRLPMVRQELFVRCELFKMQAACGQPFGIIERENAQEDASETERYEVTTDLNHPDLLTECVGGSCAEAGLDDGSYTCQRSSGATAAPAVPVGGTAEGSIGTGETATTTTTASGAATVGAGYQCRQCAIAGQTCEGIGPSNTCCGGYCGASTNTADAANARVQAGTVVEQTRDIVGATLSGTCGNGMNGTRCGDSDECRGGKCVDAALYWQGLSTLANTAGESAANIWHIVTDPTGILDRFIGGVRQAGRAVTNSTALADAWTGGICSNGAVGAPCNTDSDCGSGMVCLDDYGVHVCSRPIVGGYCTEDRHCGGNRCRDVCVGQDQTIDCSNNATCVQRYGDGYECRDGLVEDFSICTSKEDGSLCIDNSQCDSRHCYTGAIMDVGEAVGICISGEDGSGCDDNSDCNSGVCYDSDGFGQVCVGPSSESGSPCIPDQNAGQCTSGLVCNQNSSTCINPGSNSAGAAAH